MKSEHRKRAVVGYGEYGAELFARECAKRVICGLVSIHVPQHRPAHRFLPRLARYHRDYKPHLARKSQNDLRWYPELPAAVAGRRLARHNHAPASTVWRPQ